VSAIVASTDVERPASEAFAYATDPTRFSEWQQSVVDGRGRAANRPPWGQVSACDPICRC
jgi:hypothetical protein